MSARSGVVLCVLSVLARCMHVASDRYVLEEIRPAVMVGWVSPLVCAANKYRNGVCMQRLHVVVENS